HEKLIDAWPWLKKLVNENRDVIALQNEIAADAREWDDHQRDPSYFYTGARLANAREKLEVKKLVLSGLAQSFVDAGIQMEESKRQEEAKRRQKEIDDAHKIAVTERQARQRTLGFLVIALMLVGVLAFDPVRDIWLQQQALGPMLIPIPGSAVILGDSRFNLADPSFLPRDNYSIEAFSIEPYEVTNKRYLLCVKSGNCSLPIAPSAGYDGDANADLPVVKITAVQASQFCEWLGRKLPDEMQWERAARFTDERLWPWGNPNPSEHLANFYYTAEPTLQPIGQYENGKSEEGIYDLAGNVAEWTSSSYFNPGKPELDLNLATSEDRLSVRGGSYDGNYEFMSNTIAFRMPASPFAINAAIGFRCVSK
ncbi:MAG TPA: SUMF1/EgtB/PvdO family nonheme iron enzyme, partial [Anaerolineales bacterium]|nr:SUMF1/EgtB/PvdO family nonheme iron enzyme [Anaerolineales bacterium]